MNIIENKDALNKEIARFLSVERSKMGLTMQEIANRTGKSTAYVSNMLNAKASVKINTYRDFAEVGLGIPPTTFDAKVQEITRRLVGVDSAEQDDPYSLLLRDHNLPESAKADIELALQFIKQKYAKKSQKLELMGILLLELFVDTKKAVVLRKNEFFEVATASFGFEWLPEASHRTFKSILQMLEGARKIRKLLFRMCCCLLNKKPSTRLGFLRQNGHESTHLLKVCEKEYIQKPHQR